MNPPVLFGLIRRIARFGNDQCSSMAITGPPGLQHHRFTGIAASGGDGSWFPFDSKKTVTMVNAFVHDQIDQKLLLGWVKEGFGVGHLMPWVAPVEDGEDLIQATKTIVKKQTGLDAVEVTDAGGFFVVIDGSDTAISAPAFRISSWTGEPIETTEKKPEWFASTVPTAANAPLPGLPWPQMFEDEQYWFPHFNEGKKVIGRADFAAPAIPSDIVGKLERYWFGFLES